MEDNQHILRINPIIVVAVLLQLGFLIFAGITIGNILNRNSGTPKITIDNFNIISDSETIKTGGITSNTQEQNFSLSDIDKKTIESNIYDIVSINNKGDIANNGAKIREGSVRRAYIEDLNAHFINFIVDIENLKQSYRFAWLWGGNSSKQQEPIVTFLMTFCLKDDEMIYGDFNCKDNYNGHGLDIAAYNLIRRHVFDNFSTKLNDVLQEKQLRITIQLFPGEEITEETATQELSNYLSELGFNLDDFKYDFVKLKIQPLSGN